MHPPPSPKAEDIRAEAAVWAKELIHEGPLMSTLLDRYYGDEDEPAELIELRLRG